MTTILCLVGPTGAGKTGAAIRLAQAFGCGVVNVDSRQVYVDFPIITAQPSAEERAACAHRLYGFLPTDQKITAGAFMDMAAEAIEATRAEGLLPLLVGGTGLYLRALLEGLAPIPDVDPEVSERVVAACEAHGPGTSHDRLREVDPTSAARIHPNDRQRICRALEVFEATGKPLSWWHERPVPAPRYRALKLGLRMDLDALAAKCAARIDAMVRQGALDEARRAMARCADPDAPGWSGIGCAEMHAHLSGRIDLAEAKALWLRNTRAYAKRQYTWFNKDAGIHWFAPQDHAGMADAVRAFLEG